MADGTDHVVPNHLLFSQIFLDEVRSDTHDLADVRPTLSTIQATWKYHIPAPPGLEGRFGHRMPLPPLTVRRGCAPKSSSRFSLI